jgi:formate dehydrogenase iron-sulfur subunit
MHCEDPACASVCPVGALEKTKEGPVVYHPDRCMGCRYCMVACPFSIPKYEWSKAIPTVRKCQMCPDRVKEGKKPFCASFCTWGGIQSGTREEMLALARKRIAEEPDRYYPHIYGEEEVGGTSVLVIGAVPPEKLGLPIDLPKESLPKRTWAALSRLPGVVATAAAFCLSFWWITNRRDRIAEEQSAARMKEARERITAREETEVHA